MTQEELMNLITDMDKRLTVMETKLEDMKAMQEELKQMVISVNNLANSVKTLTETTNEIKNDVKNMQAQDGDTFRKIKNQAITVILGAILGFVCSKLFI